MCSNIMITSLVMNFLKKTMNIKNLKLITQKRRNFYKYKKIVITQNCKTKKVNNFYKIQLQERKLIRLKILYKKLKMSQKFIMQMECQN